MRYWDHDPMNGGWAIMMMVSMLVIWTLVIFGVAWIIRSGKTPAIHAAQAAPPPVPVPGNAEQILDERLARGDIEPEEYKARLDALRSAKQ